MTRLKVSGDPFVGSLPKSERYCDIYAASEAAGFAADRKSYSIIAF